MRQLKFSIPEYGNIPRADIPSSILKQWQRFDEHYARATGDTVFDWTNLHYLKAKNYVGVLQIGELQVEVLPKIENDSAAKQAADEVLQNSRQNLLYMLSVAGQLPFQERDLAAQKLRRLPLWEALIRVFASRLLQELRRGQQHSYLFREEELAYVCGRILIHKQLIQHTAQRHKLHVGYDEFSNDTKLNQILKMSCLRLLAFTGLVETQQLLREALLELGDVSERVLTRHDFETVQLDRNSERYRDLLEFCRIVFVGRSSSPEIGSLNTFSLLFPMECLFEQFVGSFLQKHAGMFALQRGDVHVQAQGERRWLVRDAGGKGRFRLKPDVLIRARDCQPQLILDTKWKRLKSDELDAKNGVLQADMYQLFAYAVRFECRDNVLLFPKMRGVTAKEYSLEHAPQTRLRVEYLDLSIDFWHERQKLIEEFQKVLGDCQPIRK